MGKASPRQDIRPLRAAIVGCGRISAIHIEALHALSSVEIVALCDANGDLARKRAREAGTEGVFTDLEVMMRTVQPDVVHILTPPRTHLALTETAVAHHAHVYVEKPFAPSAEDARKMLAAASRAGVHLCPGHNRLFDPIFLEARRRTEAGEIGRVLHVRAEQGFSLEAAAHASSVPWSYGYDWRIYENLMPHPLYLASHFLEEPGPPEVVDFSLGRVREAATEEIHAIIPSRAALAEIVLSLNSFPETNRVEIAGSQGRMVVDFVGLNLLVARKSGLPDAVARFTGSLGTSGQLVHSTLKNAFGIVSGRVKRYPGVRKLVAEFYRSLREGCAPPVLPEHGLLNALQLEQLRNGCRSARPSMASPTGAEEATRPSVLVTGATGLVGSRLIERLAADGLTVRATMRLASRSHPRGGVQWVRCNLQDEQEVRRALEGIETVYHCAALVGAPGTLEEYEEVNVNLTLRLARLAAEAGVRRMVYLPSIGIYQKPSWSAVYLEEDTPYETRAKDRGYYTQTEIAAERGLLRFVQDTRSPRIVILRPGTIYGPGAPIPVGRLRLPSPQNRPLVVGSGRVPMPLSYVDNVTDAIVAAARADVPSGRVYNVVDSPDLDQGTVARTLRRISQDKVGPVHLPYSLAWVLMLGVDLVSLVRQGTLGTARYRLSRTVANMRFRCAAARSELGWEPKVSLEEGLSRVLAQDRERPYPH